MLADRSDGRRKEISGITTLDEMRDAVARLEGLGVSGDAEIHSYLHVGWTGGPRIPGEEPDPAARANSVALWAEVDEA